MKTVNISQLATSLKEDGYVKVSSFLDETEIQEILSDIPNITSKYSEDFVKNRLFYPREDSHNRQGDALMVSLEDYNYSSVDHLFESSSLPRFVIKGFKRNLLEFYNQVLSEISGEVVPENSRSMMNIQQYFEHSLPVGDHYDGEFISYKHGEDKYKEFTLDVKEAILPRYVMVVVLENENSGKGTYIRYHDSEERIYINNNPGDLIIFDNIGMRHGVPELEHPRKMIGFRNFDFNPVHFISEKKDGYIELPDKVNPGFVKNISSEEAESLMLEFNTKFYKNFDEYKKLTPAF